MDFSSFGALIALLIEFAVAMIPAIVLIALTDFIPKTWQQKLGIPEQIGCRSIMFVALVLVILFEIFYDPLVIN